MNNDKFRKQEPTADTNLPYLHTDDENFHKITQGGTVDNNLQRAREDEQSLTLLTKLQTVDNNFNSVTQGLKVDNSLTLTGSYDDNS